MWSALEHATASVCGFVRRHKRAVIATGVVTLCAGGVYYGYRRMLSEAERFTQQLRVQMAEHQRLQLALASTTEESNATIQRFLPRLKKTLYQLIDLESIVHELKALDKSDKRRRNELWDQAKRTAVTRYFTALIAFGLWHLLVFAQIAIIGKRTFETSRKAPSPGGGDADDQQRLTAQHAFLASGLEYFLDHGLQRIKAHVEAVVAANEQLQAWDVSRKARVDREELNELLQAVYLAILPPQTGSHTDDQSALWRSFLIFPDKRPGQSEEVISLLNDLWDLLESDLFGPALQHSLGFLCGNAFQDLNEVVYGVTSHRFVDAEAAAQPKPSPALAKLIPALQTEVNKLLTNADGDSYLVKYSQGVGEMEAFRAFYEAVFFQQDDASEAVPRLI
ncbi:hypothetical protein P43SY_002162 [Pythium insidiosum]|uniref:Peroxisomal biogenesis factor 3 n=1 Tax=Pythium insidiosum TaxID=114742 RepID=A0AAD5LA30_PYTIN|nr:hypothetical protein P43SY_002162 [Pythium insidiosum]